MSYTTQKEIGPRADGVHQKQRSLVPADRDARRPRWRPLRRRFLQPGRRSTTTRAGRCTVRRTPPSARIAITTSAASGACSTSRRRSSTCRCLNRADLAGLIRVMQTSPNAHVKQTAWRLAQENSRVGPAPRADQEADGAARRSRSTSRRAPRRRPRSARPCSTRFAAATGQLDDDRRSWPRRPSRRSSYVAEALAYSRPQALTDFVVAVLPAALPMHASGPAASRPPAAGPDAVALKTSVVRAVARMEGGAIALERRDDAGPADAARRSDDEGRGACRSWRSGTRRARCARRPTSHAALDAARTLADAATSDDRRVDSAAAPACGSRHAGRRRSPRSRRCCPTRRCRRRSKAA